MKMQITIDGKKILWTSISLILGWLSYISVTAINNNSEISRLQEKTSADGRQDEELREIRQSIQQMTVLFFEQHEMGEPPMYEDPSSPDSMDAVQMDLESIIKRKR